MRLSHARWQIARRIVVLAAAVVVMLGLALIPYSNVPKRGGEMFGGIAKKIQRNPRTTAIVSIGAVAGLWLAVGLLAAGQEWIARRPVRTAEKSGG